MFLTFCRFRRGGLCFARRIIEHLMLLWWVARATIVRRLASLAYAHYCFCFCMVRSITPTLTLSTLSRHHVQACYTPVAGVGGSLEHS